jgi:uncharacterized protein YndB with AHSA1/START domain
MASYEVRRTITIKAEPAKVYDKIADLHEWESWSPWEGMDPAMTKTYRGPDAGVGSTYSWKGNRKVGEGKMTITDAVPPSRVTLDIQFLRPFKSQSETAFGLDYIDQGTGVTWTMTGDHTFLSRIMSVFVSMDKMVGKDFERGLAQLKSSIES